MACWKRSGSAEKRTPTADSTCMRAIDKLIVLAWPGSGNCSARVARTSSGDFTPGAGLSRSGDRNGSTTCLQPSSDVEERIAQIARGRAPATWVTRGGRSWQQIDALVKACGYGSDRIVVEPSVVRGLEYYTGPVYEVELTFAVEGEER